MALLTDNQLSADALPDVYKNRWFASLPAAQQAALLRCAKTVWLQDQQMVFRKNAAVRARRDGFALLVKGSLKVSSSTPDGREAILTYVQPGQWFGELSVLDQRQRARDVSSVGQSQLLVVESAEFSRMMDIPAFAHSVVDLLTSRTRLMLDLLEDFSLRTTRSRAARRLIMLAADDDPYQPPTRKDLKVSHDALASMMGLTRPALASQLKTLTQMGAIAQGYGKISITSMVTLMAEAAVG
jgi:CRP/FNR family transcriptional regulator, cyclic AMP receptor protein